MRRLMDARDARAHGRAQARAFAEANDVREPYSAILDSEAYRRRRKSEKLLAELLARRGRRPAHEREPASTPSALGRGSGASPPASRSRGPSTARSRVTRGIGEVARTVAALLRVRRARVPARGRLPGARRRAARGRARCGSRCGSPRRRRARSSSAEELREGLSDLAFTDAYRVPYPYRAAAAPPPARGRAARGLGGRAPARPRRQLELRPRRLVRRERVRRSTSTRSASSARPSACASSGPCSARYHPVILDNVRRLREISGLDEVSFHMSGTEAVMQAVALARYHTRPQPPRALLRRLPRLVGRRAARRRQSARRARRLHARRNERGHAARARDAP